MHIPDGFLDLKTASASAAASAAGIGYCLHRVKSIHKDRTAPLMGMMAACVFAGQMVNFPVMAGTSGHLCGGVLAAIVLGPWGGAVVMAVVLIVQCLLFGDGGVFALGANVLNLGLIGAILGYCIYASIRRCIRGRGGIIVAGVVAAWFSVLLSAMACAIQLWSSGLYPLTPTLYAMLLVHAAVGVGEAVITGLTLSFLVRTRPEILYTEGPPISRLTRSLQTAAGGLSIALVIAVFLSPFAAPTPDGLESVVASLGLNAAADAPTLSAPMSDYRMPGLETLVLAGSSAGFVGTLIVFAVAFCVGRRLGWTDLPGSAQAG